MRMNKIKKHRKIVGQIFLGTYTMLVIVCVTTKQSGEKKKKTLNINGPWDRVLRKVIL